MADIAMIFHFGHAEMCAWDLPKLTRWRARARRRADPET